MCCGGFVPWRPQTPRLLPSHYSTDVASISRYHMVPDGCSGLRQDIQILSQRKKQNVKNKNKRLGGRHIVIFVVLRKIPCSLTIVLRSHWPELSHMGTSSYKGDLTV